MTYVRLSPDQQDVDRPEAWAQVEYIDTVIRRERNRMVPTSLLRQLRLAQRWQVDGQAAIDAVHAIDAWVERHGT